MSDRAGSQSLVGSNSEPDWLNSLLNAGTQVAVAQVNRALGQDESTRRAALAETRGEAAGQWLEWLKANWWMVAIAIVVPGGFILWLVSRKSD